MAGDWQWDACGPVFACVVVHSFVWCLKAQKLEEDAKAIDEIRQAGIGIHNRNRVVEQLMPVADPACKPTVTLSSPSLFFQPSKPSSCSDWSSLDMCARDFV